MMSFDPLWETLKAKDITTYQLIKEYNLSRGMLDRFKHNRNVTLETVDWLCTVLDCRIEDVVVYCKEE